MESCGISYRINELDLAMSRGQLRTSLLVSCWVVTAVVVQLLVVSLMIPRHFAKYMLSCN